MAKGGAAGAASAQTEQGSRKRRGIYARFVKRALDVVLATLLLILFWWLFAIVAILVRVKLGSPVIFKQERPGLNGKIFEMYKFRTMLPPQTRDGGVLTDAERLRCLENGIDVLSDEERLTKFGRMLRALSIDELPELFNILKGDMSFVGPRPLAVIYLPYYTHEEMRRHDERPGLTGAAQVHGRNAARWVDRFSYDLQYVEQVSFLTDAKILVDTVGVVLSREDVAQGAERPEAFHEVRMREIEEGLIDATNIPGYSCDEPTKGQGI